MQLLPGTTADITRSATGWRVVCGHRPATAVPTGFDWPSLRTMRRGVERLRLGARRLRLDQDTFIALNAGTDRAAAYDGADGVTPLAVGFRPEMLGWCNAAADAPDDEAAACPLRFVEALQPQGGAVSRALAAIERGSNDGETDAFWWEEQVLSLLAALADAERRLQAREALMLGAKPATRRELLRRVLMASDYIHSCYEQPITLHDIAAAAHLSRFHLVRLFRLAHGLTPHAYLTRRRVAVALRLIAQTPLGLNEVAQRTGLGTRSSLFRHLRRQQGSGAAALRARADEAPPCAISA